jgi:hypothetical protein
VSRVSAQFEPRPSEVRAARHFVTDVVRAEGVGVPEFLPLLASELASNAVLHARTPFSVTVDIGAQRVRIEVDDGNPELPVRANPSAATVTGRGILMVSELADRWGAESVGSGKSVWFEFDRGQALLQMGVG